MTVVTGPIRRTSVVRFENVGLRYSLGPEVLQDVSFSVAQGETRILLGPTGVGKSVLLKLTNGLLSPDQGCIQLFGEDISRMSEDNLFPLRARTGMVFQEGALRVPELPADQPPPSPERLAEVAKQYVEQILHHLERNALLEAETGPDNQPASPS